MTIDAFLFAEATSGFVYLVVGVRLYLLSRTTGYRSDALIAASFLLWMLSYAIYDIPYALATSEEMVASGYSYGSLVALALGNIVFTFFIRTVFQPNARWAMWLVVAVALGNLAGLIGAAWTGDWAGIEEHTRVSYWLERFGSFAPVIWMAVEGLSQYSRTRKRKKLGLCEPMLCHRFLLWGIAGSLWVVLEVLVTAEDLIYSVMGRWSEGLSAGIGVLEFVPILIIWLVFFPPAFYSRGIEGKDVPDPA